MAQYQPHQFNVPLPTRRTLIRDALNRTFLSVQEVTGDEKMRSAPDLKIAVERAIEIVKTMEDANPSVGSLFELYIQLKRLGYVLASFSPFLQHQGEQEGKVNHLTSELTRFAKDWEKLHSPHDLLDFVGDQEECSAVVTDISRRIEESVDTVLENIYATGTIATKILPSNEVQNIPHLDASFNSSSRKGTPTCFVGTRECVLDDILGWIVGDGDRVYVLRGPSGVGKTTIAQTIANLTANANYLAVSISLSGCKEGGTLSRLFFPTIAYQLAQFHKTFALRIIRALSKWPNALSEVPSEQLKKLIVDPLQDVSELGGDPMLIVLDGLDECATAEGQGVLRLLMGAISQLPPNFKFLVTVRPQSQLLSILNWSKSRHQPFHDVETMVDQEDIRHYLRHHLSPEEVQKLPSAHNWKNEPHDLEVLVQAAGQLFIVASTMEKFIKDGVQRNPHQQLEILLGVLREGGPALHPYFKLDSLYMFILTFTVTSNPSSGNILQNFVGSIIVLQHPLPLPSLANLVGIGLDACRDTLKSLQSVINTDSDDMSHQIVHPSFSEFITDASRCGDEKLWIELPKHHERIACLCFYIMGQKLQRNTCHLSTTEQSMRNDNIPDLKARIKEHIPPELEYACIYWAVHLSEAPPSSELVGRLWAFAITRLLSWFEILSLIGRLDLAHPALVSAKRAAAINRSPDELLTVLNDAQRFLTEFYPSIKLTAHNVYHQALPSAPRQSVLFQTYKYEVEHLSEVKPRGENWDLQVLDLKNSSNSFGFSPDGTRLVVVSKLGDVGLWDVVTGSMVLTKGWQGERPWGGTTFAIFSPDGKRLVSRTCPERVELWDSVSGGTIALLEASKWEYGFMFSSDGGRLACRSEGGIVSLWDGVTGDVFPMQGCHSKRVTSLSFSPGGSRLVSGSEDGDLRLWDSISGAPIAKLDNQWGAVNSVAFSPDGSNLVIGALLGMGGMWDGVTGDVLPIVGIHPECITSIVFSPDGSRLAYGSHDGTAVLLEGGSGAIVAKLEGHLSEVHSVIFSADGGRLVTRSNDGIVRIWDGITGGGIAGPLLGVTFVVFSPDGRYLAVGLEDGGIGLRNGVTGVTITELAGDLHPSNSMIFSSDGMLLASMSEHSVSVWDVFSAVTYATGHLQPTQPTQPELEFPPSNSLSYDPRQPPTGTHPNPQTVPAREDSKLDDFSVTWADDPNHWSTVLDDIARGPLYQESADTTGETIDNLVIGRPCKTRHDVLKVLCDTIEETARSIPHYREAVLRLAERCRLVMYAFERWCEEFQKTYTEPLTSLYRAFVFGRMVSDRQLQIDFKRILEFLRSLKDQPLEFFLDSSLFPRVLNNAAKLLLLPRSFLHLSQESLQRENNCFDIALFYDRGDLGMATSTPSS